MAIRSTVEQNSKLAIAFEQYVIRTIRNADMLAQLILNEYAHSGRNIDSARLMRASAIDRGLFSGFAVADEHGNVVTTSYPAAAATDGNVADNEYFSTHLAPGSGDVFIGKPIIAETLGQPSVPISRRISKPDGSFGGVVVVHIQPKRFTEFYKEASLRPGDIIALTGLDGINRARRAGNTESYGEDVQTSQVFSLRRQTPHGSYTAPNVIGGIESFFSYRSLSAYPLIVVTGTAKNEALAEVAARRDRYYTGATLLSILIALFSAALAASHRRQQHALDRLGESETLLRALGDALPQLIWVCNPDGRSFLVNQRWIDYTGKKAADFTDEGWADCAHTEDCARVQAEWKRSVETGCTFETEYRLRRRDGAYRWTLARATPMRDAAGRVVRWVGTCTDIEEQKKSAAAVQQARHFAQATIDALSEHIAVIDVSGRILTVNKAWRKFAVDNGAAHAPVCEGANYLEVCRNAADAGDGDAARVAEMLCAVAAGTRATASMEYACHSLSEQRWYLLNITRFDTDAAPRIVAAHGNITTRKLAENLLQEMSVHQLTIRDEERKRIAREIHDELGQRLTALRMDALMLPRTLGDQSPALRASVGEMRDAIDGILRIVRNIAAELRPPVLDIGLVTAIEWLVEEFQARVELRCSFRNLAGNNVPVDDERATGIFRILQESLTNVARHACASKVDITLSVRGNRLLLEVADDGIGFDPRQAGASKSYGLVGMRERAAMMNGEIAITSIPDPGTTVRVSIPL